MWYHTKPYVLVVGGIVAAMNAGWPGIFAGAFAIMMGIWVLRMRKVI